MEVRQMVTQESTEEARLYLVENLIPKFKDTCFRQYVLDKLAGDFAYQLSEYLKQNKEETQTAKENFIASITVQQICLLDINLEDTKQEFYKFCENIGI